MYNVQCTIKTTNLFFNIRARREEKIQRRFRQFGYDISTLFIKTV